MNYDPTSASRVKFCEAQGFLLLYTDLTVILAILSITVNLFISVYFDKKPRRLEMYATCVLDYSKPLVQTPAPLVQTP